MKFWDLSGARYSCNVKILQVQWAVEAWKQINREIIKKFFFTCGITTNYTILYCTVLYCTVLYCTVLYCTVLYCTVLYCTVLYCTVLYCTVLYCTVLHCTALYCTVLTCIEANQTELYWTKNWTEFNWTEPFRIELGSNEIKVCWPKLWKVCNRDAQLLWRSIRNMWGCLYRFIVSSTRYVMFLKATSNMTSTLTTIPR